MNGKANPDGLLPLFYIQGVLQCFSYKAVNNIGTRKKILLEQDRNSFLMEKFF